MTLPVTSAGAASPSAFAGQIERAVCSADAVARHGVILGKPGQGVAAAEGFNRREASSWRQERPLLPFGMGSISNPAPQPMKITGGQLTLDFKQGDTKETPEKLEGLLVLTRGSGEGERIGYTVFASTRPGFGRCWRPFRSCRQFRRGKRSHTVGGNVGDIRGWAFAVLFAFLGGAILNLMPCVFPVLALKALALPKKGRAWSLAAGHRLSRRRACELWSHCSLHRHLPRECGGFGLGLSIPVARFCVGARRPVLRDGPQPVRRRVVRRGADVDWRQPVPQTRKRRLFLHRNACRNRSDALYRPVHGRSHRLRHDPTVLYPTGGHARLGLGFAACCHFEYQPGPATHFAEAGRLDGHAEAGARLSSLRDCGLACVGPQAFRPEAMA